MPERGTYVDMVVVVVSVVVVLEDSYVSTTSGLPLSWFFISYVVVVSGMELIEEFVVVVVILASFSINTMAHA